MNTRAGTITLRREVGSSVFQVFEGGARSFSIGWKTKLEKGDLFVVPSWMAWSLQFETQFDLPFFRSAGD